MFDKSYGKSPVLPQELCEFAMTDWSGQFWQRVNPSMLSREHALEISCEH